MLSLFFAPDLLYESFQGQPCVRLSLSALQRSTPLKVLAHSEERPVASNYLIENKISAGRIIGRVEQVSGTLCESNTKLQQHLLLDNVQPSCALLVPVSWVV